MFARLSTFGIWLGCLAIGVFVGSRGAEVTELRFFSVGQGDCAVFRHRGQTILIDVGPAKEDSDQAAIQIAKKLRELGVSRVDLALLSHPDADHIGGLRGLSQRVNICRVATMAHYKDNPDLEYWLRAAKIASGDVLWLERGNEIVSGDFRLEIDSARHYPADSDNHGSMMIRLEGLGASADFTGDADELAELEVLRDGAWGAQVLKAGHHGSKTSTCSAWLAAVHPSTVVISCGRDNSYGHPHQDTLNRIADAGSQALRTDTLGDIAFKVANGRFQRQQ